MAKTISMSVGRVSILHDIRQEISPNVDPTLSHQNRIFIDKLAEFNYDIEAYTNAKYQPYIDEYNARQTRENRKKTKPYTELIAEENEKLIQKAEDNKRKGIKMSLRKPTKLVHEYVLQIGDRESDGVSSVNTDINAHRELAYRTIKEIEKRYPHAEILLAVFHADEPNGTPHMHLLIQFIGEDYKQGLSHQISMSKALELDGFPRSQNRGDYAINRWCKEIKDSIMTPLLNEIMHEERKELNEHRKHEDIRFFREKAKVEAKALKEEREATHEAQTEYKTYVDSQDNRLNQIRDKLLESRDELIEAQNELNTKEHIFKTEKAEFEAYKSSQTQTIQEHALALDRKELQLKSFADRAYEMFCEAKEFLDKAKRLFETLDKEHKSLYQKPIVELDESLLSYQTKKQHSLTL